MYSFIRSLRYLAVNPAVNDKQSISQGTGTEGRRRTVGVTSPHVEYAEQRMKHGILFLFSPCYEHSNLECVR